MYTDFLEREFLKAMQLPQENQDPVHRRNHTVTLLGLPTICYDKLLLYCNWRVEIVFWLKLWLDHRFRCKVERRFLEMYVHSVHLCLFSTGKAQKQGCVRVSA